MKDMLSALFTSRKFLVTILATTAVTVLVALGKIQPDQYATTVAALTIALVAAIAHEDAAMKRSPGGTPLIGTEAFTTLDSSPAAAPTSVVLPLGPPMTFQPPPDSIPVDVVTPDDVPTNPKG